MWEEAPYCLHPYSGSCKVEVMVDRTSACFAGQCCFATYLTGSNYRWMSLGEDIAAIAAELHLEV